MCAGSECSRSGSAASRRESSSAAERAWPAAMPKLGLASHVAWPSRTEGSIAAPRRGECSTTWARWYITRSQIPAGVGPGAGSAAGNSASEAWNPDTLARMVGRRGCVAGSGVKGSVCASRQNYARGRERRSASGETTTHVQPTLWKSTIRPSSTYILARQYLVSPCAPAPVPSSTSPPVQSSPATTSPAVPARANRSPAHGSRNPLTASSPSPPGNMSGSGTAAAP
ncbi:hypothetical protein DFJ74DRAFT_647811 [Hyaloraphidium curvatum]|nr:hypothetical protein DFJ74DRAFT_647811 [Hyaloraphidium curvatum]